MSKTKLEMAGLEKAKAFMSVFKIEDEVAVLQDDGSRVIGVLAISPTVQKKTGHVKVYVDIPQPPNKDGDIQIIKTEVALDRVRARAIEERKTKNFLRVELTTDEKLDLANEMSDAFAAKTALESELAAVKKQFAGDIQTQEATIGARAEKLRTGYESRNVDCSLVLDFDTGKAKETRLDTDEVIKDRNLYPEESQRGLDLFPEVGNDPDQDGQKDATDAKPATPKPGKKKKGEEKVMDESKMQAAIEVLRETGRASTAAIQRRLRVSLNDASLIMDELEEKGIVGPPKGSDPREILVRLDKKPEGATDGKTPDEKKTD